MRIFQGIPPLQISLSFCWLLLGLATTGCGLNNTNLRPHSHDHFVGWFQTTSQPQPERLLLILRRGEEFFTICHGVEIPLRCGPDELVWNITPSSLSGTKIGYEAASKSYYLSVHDALASQYTEGNYGVGAREPLVRTTPPAHWREPHDPPPATPADLVGWYQPQFMPPWKIGIIRTNGTYARWNFEFRAPESGGWQPEGQPAEATPLGDQPGFTFLSGQESLRLIYNATLQRYELVQLKNEALPGILVMPLVRIAPPHASDPAPDSQRVIGIPAWR